MATNTYQPNFSDPRIRRRSIKALEFVEQRIKNSNTWLSTREIARHFGWPRQNSLAQYLRQQLLICTDQYFNMQTGQCKRYTVNQEGTKQIKAQLGITDLAPSISQEHQQQLRSGQFEYLDKSSREYHPLQNLPRRQKVPLLSRHGYRHEYDIKCAAQTLILQHARSLGFDRATPALDRYIQDRTSVRQELSESLGLDTLTVKKCLTAILNGASISQWHENHIFQLVNYSRPHIERLRENLYIQQYQREVRQMWRQIRKSLTLAPRQRFNAKMKSLIYRSLEESVRSVIKRSLTKDKNRAFIEHDGWTCQRAVDIDRLCLQVRNKTGFVIELDWTIHEYRDPY